MDGCRGGWVSVVLVATGPLTVAVGVDPAELIGRFADVACVGVDMPIGLPVDERGADAQARRFVGPRGSSVFAAPPAEVLAANSYAEANAIAARRASGKKISQQAWALRANIAAVAAVAKQDGRVIEVHPEVSFRALVGEPLRFSKQSYNGQAVRRAALARVGIELPEQLEEAGVVPVADVLDAAAAAWSARRYAEGRAQSFPEDARRGAREVIWY